MKKLIKRLSRVADSSQYSLLRSESRTSGRSFRGGGKLRVPDGHLPVYVGEEMERFMVRAELLNHPIFVTLLNKSAQEYGYHQKGVLRIPCHVFLFERLLEAIRLDAGAGSRAGADHHSDRFSSADLEDLYNSLSDQGFL